MAVDAGGERSEDGARIGRHQPGHAEARGGLARLRPDDRHGSRRHRRGGEGAAVEALAGQGHEEVAGRAPAASRGRRP